MDEKDEQAESKRMKNLPTPVRSVQYDLFSDFYGDQSKLSNTIELWDAIPKYSCSARLQSTQRDENGRLASYEREFIYKRQDTQDEIPARMVLTPARIKVDGKEVDFLPSADEELIEEVLRKFFADQACGRHYPKEAESFVDFSLAMIAKELRLRGRSRSLNEIKRSLDIMNGCRLNLFFHGDKKKAAYKAAIIPEIMEVSREEYVTDPKGRWRVRLPFVYSSAVNKLEFRQFNYATLMSMSSALARWMHKLMSRRYVNANILQPYSLKYSSIRRDSGLLNHSRESRNKKTVIDAIEELKEQDVLMIYEVGASVNDPKDPLYILTPSPSFVAEVKAANKRQKDGKSSISKR